MRLAARAHHLCRSGSPDPDPFGSRRSRTTETETHIMTMAIAGDRPPRYGEKTPPFHVGRGPVPRHRSRHPTRAGDRPPRYEKNANPHRRARALACHTRIRAGFPRHRSRAIQRSRGTGPALREKKRPLTVGRGPSDATRASERVPLAIVLS